MIAWLQLFSKVQDLIYRFSPSIALLILTSLLSSKVGSVSDLIFEGLIIYPVLMPIIRFGLPLKILDKNTELDVSKYNSIILVLIFISFVGGILFLLFNVKWFFFIFIASMGSVTYINGTANIRKGNRIGYLKYNAPVYIVLMFYLFLGQISLYLALVMTFIFLVKRLGQKVRINLQEISLIGWLNDCTISLVLPLAIYMVISQLDTMGPDEYMLIKVSGLMSSSIASLLILKVSSIESAQLVSLFLRIKRDLRPYGLLGFLLLLVFSYLSFGVELLIATIGLGLIELAALSFGQYNMLNVLTGNQRAILVTSFAVSAVSFCFYIVLSTGVYIDDPNLGFVIYGIILLLWQFASYLTHRYA